MEDGVGKEVVVVYKTEIRSNETFFTDSNGRQLVKRKRGARWENIRGCKGRVQKPQLRKNSAKGAGGGTPLFR